MVPVVCSSVSINITAKSGLAEGDGARVPGFLRTLLRCKTTGEPAQEFKPIKDTILVPIGPPGVGRLFGILFVI